MWATFVCKLYHDYEANMFDQDLVATTSKVVSDPVRVRYDLVEYASTTPLATR